MTDEYKYLVHKAIPWTAVIAAIGLAWTMAGSLISVRDDILSHCHSVELRITGLEVWRAGHEAEDERRHAELTRAIQAKP